MNKTQMVALGFAGVAAATVMGTALLGGDSGTNPDRATEPRQDGSSYQSESNASGEMQQFLIKSAPLTTKNKSF
jgi:hypothetical protein